MLHQVMKPVAVATTLAIVLGSAMALPVGNAVAAETNLSTRSQLPDFVNLVDQYGSGVVNISTVRKARVLEAQDPFGGLDERHAEIFRRFGFPIMPFGGQREEPERRGTGSGFIVSNDGLILTNHHVVDGADEILVRLTDGREFKGKVLGSDEKTDIAVVKIEAKGLSVLKMGNSDTLKVGEWVAAIGSPFGLDNSVTSGIVSAKSRKLPSDQYVPFIQTDVAVNPGNSGGPLFNMDGDVVGINSQIFSTTGGFMGMSFAIPINLAMQIKDQLVQHGKVSRGRIGVVIQSLSPELAESFGLKNNKGAIVTQIDKDGPAAKSGLQEGDVITAINGKNVDSSGDIPVAIGSMAPGSKARLSVIRDKKPLTISINVVEADNTPTKSAEKQSSNATKLGVTVRALTSEEQKESGATGLLVLESQGAAKSAGIVAGDIIVSVNGKTMKRTEDLGSMLEQTKLLRVLVQRRDGRIFIPIRLK